MALASSAMERFMKVLALDTAGWECSVALWEDGRELAFQHQSSERDQASLLPHLVEEVMGTEKVDCLLVNSGPGSFTGIRIGLSYAKGLAMGLGLPLKAIDHFTAIYLTLKTHPNVLVLIESRRQDVYGRRFLKGIPQAPQMLTRKDIEELLSSPTPPLLAGNGVCPLLKGLSFQDIPSPWRGAQRLAYAFFKNSSVGTDPLPFYVREADVTFSSHTCRFAS